MVVTLNLAEVWIRITETIKLVGQARHLANGSDHMNQVKTGLL